MKRVMPEMGCVIDGSHMSNFDFITAVIDYAIDRGFEVDLETYRMDVYDMRNGNVDDEWIMEVMNALDWTYEDALEYLNEIDLHRGYVWVVDEQSLFRERSDD